MLEHHDLEPLTLCIFRRESHAEVECQAGEENAPQAAFAQVSGKPRVRPVIVLIKRRIGIDLAMITLTQNELGMRDPKIIAQLRSRRALHAVVRPQDLRAVAKLNGFIGISVGMAGGKGKVPARMPVLGENHMREPLCQSIDERHDLVAARDRERAAGTEVVLNVDHQQNILRADSDLLSH